MIIKPTIHEVSYERKVVGIALSSNDVGLLCLRCQPQYWSGTAHDIFTWGRNLSMAVYNIILFSFYIALCE
jgi:hypothetical protein